MYTHEQKLNNHQNLKIDSIISINISEISIQEAQRKHFQLPFILQEYYFTEIIGKGSYSTVYKAKHGNDTIANKYQLIF
jgi:hypothetical protein